MQLKKIFTVNHSCIFLEEINWNIKQGMAQAYMHVVSYFIHCSYNFY